MNPMPESVDGQEAADPDETKEVIPVIRRLEGLRDRQQGCGCGGNQTVSKSRRLAGTNCTDVCRRL